MGEEGGRAGTRGLWDPTSVGTGPGHHPHPRTWSPGPALRLGFSSLETQVPTGKNFTEQGWGGKRFIISPCLPAQRLQRCHREDRPRRPSQRHGAAAVPETAPGWGGNHGPASKFRGGQGQAPAAPGTRARSQAVPPALTRLMCRCLLVPGRTRHLRSGFWEVSGCRREMPRHRNFDGRALPGHGLALSQRCPGSRPSPGLVAPGSAIRGWRQPGAPVTGRRCWRCANTAGTGPEAAAANTDSPEICWHGRSATGAGPTPALLEPGPASQRCADGYQGWPGSGGSTTPTENRVKPKPLPVPIPSC